VKEPVGHRQGQAPPLRRLDQRQHHVERRGAAGTGAAVAVDFVQRTRQLQMGEALRDGRNVFPMRGASIAGQQPGPGQDVGSAGNPADPGAARRLRPQPGQGGGVIEGAGVAAGADEDGIEARRSLYRPSSRPMIRNDGDTVGRTHRPPVRRDVDPLIQGGARQVVGGAVRLHRAAIGHQGEVGDQQEADACRRDVRAQVQGGPRHRPARVGWSRGWESSGRVGRHLFASK
jgi:hypothetical protein